VGTSEQIVERLQTIVDAGADYFIVSLPRIAYDQEPIHRFAKEVVPHFS
jgi:alkanesulfonate monooxygenase SsuD/methylene tetrahydromethanopterin reductase-like flavin-dependent oxidoreductase (luciferase family)